MTYRKIEKIKTTQKNTKQLKEANGANLIQKKG